MVRNTKNLASLKVAVPAMPINRYIVLTFGIFPKDRGSVYFKDLGCLGWEGWEDQTRGAMMKKTPLYKE